MATTSWLPQADTMPCLLQFAHGKTADEEVIALLEESRLDFQVRLAGVPLRLHCVYIVAAGQCLMLQEAVPAQAAGLLSLFSRIRPHMQPHDSVCQTCKVTATHLVLPLCCRLSTAAAQPRTASCSRPWARMLWGPTPRPGWCWSAQRQTWRRSSRSWLRWPAWRRPLGCTTS